MPGTSSSHASNKSASPKKASTPTQEKEKNEATFNPLHPLQEFSRNTQIQNMKVFCSICLVEVVGSDVLGHLYFGSLKCTKCFHAIKKCQEFRNDYPLNKKCSSNDGSHLMTQWNMPLWSTFYYNVNRNFVITQFCGVDKASAVSRKMGMAIFLRKHLESLMPLKEIEPWKTAFEHEDFKEKINTFMNMHIPQELMEKQDQTEKQDKTENQDKTEKQDKTGKQDKTEKQDKTGKQDKTEKQDEMEPPSSISEKKSSPYSASKMNPLQTPKRENSETQIDMKYHDMLPKSVLASNQYLLIQYPQQSCPEECPNCYFTFTPELCVVNLCTFMIDLQCPNCKLSVYVVPVNLLTKCEQKEWESTCK